MLPYVAVGAVDGLLIYVPARIAEAVSVPVETGGHLLAVKAGFGVVGGGTGSDPDELMRHADIAMDESTEAGAGRQVPDRPGMTIRPGNAARR